MTPAAKGMGEFEGRVAIVTGAARGIGCCIVERLASEGAIVAAVDILGIDAAGARIRPYRVDLRREDAVAELVRTVVDTCGGIDILVNNAAAVTPAVPVDALALADWENAFAVNVTSAFLLSKYAIPHMRGRKGAAIVNVASQLAHVGALGKAAYSSSKAALVALTRGLAIDLAADGIRANSLSPGPVWTERMAPGHADRAAADSKIGPSTLAGRVALPEEIAEAALFLSGKRSSYMTGADLVVDGGFTAR
jgi:NAD(P)-dependent dehydrogenase (short-subunit alcohol dehydrogenase family)